jgi:hypothetical protein
MQAQYRIPLVMVMALSFGCGGAVSEKDTSASEQELTSSWKPLLVCDSGAASLDVNADERRNLQFVIRNRDIIDYLNRAGAVHSQYGATEVIASGWTGSMDWKNEYGPRLGNYQPYGGNGVFSARDFSEMIADHNYYSGPFGPFIRVARDGRGIIIQYGSIEKRGCAKETTYCPGDGFPCSTYCEIDYTEYVEKANWRFRDCK